MIALAGIFIKSIKNSTKIAISYSTTALKSDAVLRPIKMSYASYESTQTTEGEEPAPLLIMHGLFGSKANWYGFCKQFHEKTSPNRKVIAVDARNHGDSPHSKNHSYPHLAEDIKYLLKYLKINKVALLGHSVGGRAVMYFALKYPELVDKLIIGDISPHRNSSSFRSIVKIFVALQKVTLPSNIGMSAARISADIQLSRSINGKGLRAFLLQNLVQKSDGSFSWRINLPSLIRNFSQNVLKFPHVTDFQFKGPVLFLSGGASDFIQKSEHVKILKLFPNAEFQVIEGAGHWIYTDKPKEFLKYSSDFLNNQKVSSSGVSKKQ